MIFELTISDAFEPSGDLTAEAELVWTTTGRSAAQRGPDDALCVFFADSPAEFNRLDGGWFGINQRGPRRDVPFFGAPADTEPPAVLSVPLERIRSLLDTISSSYESTTAPAVRAQCWSAVGVPGILRRLARARPERNGRYLMDFGPGYLFADLFRCVARYCPERRGWLLFNGRCWESDPDGLGCMELLRRLIDSLFVHSGGIADAARQEGFRKTVAAWSRRSRREQILKDAAGVYPVSGCELDADPWLLNLENGTLDLRSGELLPHNPDDLFTLCAPVQFDPHARSPRWLEFIGEITSAPEADDWIQRPELAAYLRRCFGYALTGDTSRECFFLLFGPSSRNGKGTLCESFAGLLGGYARAVRPETLALGAHRTGGGPSEDIARLQGARFVNVSEPDKGLELNAALVKSLTGGDTITARSPYQRSIEYRPHFKLFIGSNYLPRTTDVTLFTSGRVNVLPFDRHFSPTERDPKLKARFSTPVERSAILNWALAGLRELLSGATLSPPPEVLAATADYRLRSDKLGRFLAERCEEVPGARIRTVDFYAAYEQWSFAEGGRGWAESQQWMTGQLVDRGFSVRRATVDGQKATFLFGWQLKPPD